jgi:hypothetical protein
MYRAIMPKKGTRLLFFGDLCGFPFDICGALTPTGNDAFVRIIS